jgi:penicillin-binding protein 2
MAYTPSPPDRSGGLVQSHRGYDPRLWLFQGILVLMLLVLITGLGYQQLGRADTHRDRETVQSQRRVVVPGPRGKIFDREGRLLVGNTPRFAVTLNLDELHGEFYKEFLRVRRNYRESGDKDLPSGDQLRQIARIAVVQRHLHAVNRILHTRHRVDAKALERHYKQSRILPYLLLEDIAPEQYARLLEQLPVRSPLQVYTASTRLYPHGALAAHVLGYTGVDDDIEVGDALPGAELTTFKMRGARGKNGLELQLDSRLQGQAGGAIYRVSPAGYRILPPLEKRRPVQGEDVVVSLDLDLQRAADEQITATGLPGAVVALDVATGEVLAMLSKPDFDLNTLSPRLSPEVNADINARGAWQNRATQGLYPPGSTFKLVTSIAGLRSGHIEPDSSVECSGAYRVGGRTFVCNNHRDRGTITLAQAIEKSCNTFYYDYGLKTGIDAIADEARRHGLDDQTGIELPYETRYMLVPDPEWREKRSGERWFPGDTANVSIGQGDLALTPLQMACFAASLARGETVTRPTIFHRADAPRQRSEPDGLLPAHRAAILAGMEAVTNTGTGQILKRKYSVPGLRLAGKTGTAQKRTSEGTLNFAWFVGFAPVENPQIAVAVIVEGDTPGEDVGGGRYAAPVAGAIIKAWAEKSGNYGAAAVPAPAQTTPGLR